MRPLNYGPLIAKVVSRAFTEALHFIKTNKEETKALIAKNLKTNDPEGLERLPRLQRRVPGGALS